MASRSLGAVTLDLLLKIGGFTKGLDQAAKESKRATDSMKSSFDGVNKVLKTFGVGLSIESVRRIGAAFVAAGHEAIKYGDELAKAQAKTGVAAEVFSELAVVAEKSEIGIDQLGIAFKKMQVAVSNAGSGSKAIMSTFDALGINFENFQKLKPEQQFEELADAIRALPDEADRARAATELFGRAGANLLPLFEKGALGIRQARNEAREFAQTLNREQIAALSAADEAIDNLSASWEGLKRQQAAAFAPGVTVGIKTATKAISDQGSVLDVASLLWDSFWSAVTLPEDEQTSTIFGLQSMFDVVRAMEHQLTPTEKAAEEYRRTLKDLKKMNDDGVISQREMNEAVEQAAKDYQAAAYASSQFTPEHGPRRSLANQLVAPGGHQRRRPGPGFDKDPVADAAAKAAAKEAEAAREAILKQITALEQQGAVLGQTEEATIRYRIAFGDLVDDFEKAGPAFEKRKQELIDAAAAFDKFKANEELTKANEAIEQQVVDLQAARIEYEQGAAAAYEYRAQHGELAKTLDLATDSQTALNAEVKKGADAAAGLEQAAAVSAIEEMIRSTELETTQIIANKIAMEQGAVAALRYQIAHGNLKHVFDDATEAGKALQAELERVTAAQEEIQHAQDAAAASEEYIPDALKAAQHYSLVLEGLAARLKAGTIAQDDYNQAVKRAKKDYEDALKAGDEFSAFMDEAQRAAQQSLAEFFYDPLKEGLAGMVEGFADAVRQIAANIVAAKLAEKLFEGMEDSFDKVGGLFSGAGGGLGGLLDIIGIKIDGRTPPFNPDPSQMPVDPGLGAAVTPLLPDPALAAASATLTAGATTLTSGATVLTTGSTTLTTAATALLGAATALSGAAAALAASGAASAAGSGLSDILVTAKRIATGGKVTGPGTGTSDSIPAFVSTGEYWLRSKVVAEPGAEAFLNEFNRVGMAALHNIALYKHLPRMTHAPLTRTPLRFAAGGIVGGSSAKVVAKSPMVVQQSITIHSPNGQVSRSTEMQVSASAARGVKIADRRNN